MEGSKLHRGEMNQKLPDECIMKHQQNRACVHVQACCTVLCQSSVLIILFYFFIYRIRAIWNFTQPQHIIVQFTLQEIQTF